MEDKENQIHCPNSSWRHRWILSRGKVPLLNLHVVKACEKVEVLVLVVLMLTGTPCQQGRCGREGEEKICCPDRESDIEWLRCSVLSRQSVMCAMESWGFEFDLRRGSLVDRLSSAEWLERDVFICPGELPVAAVYCDSLLFCQSVLQPSWRSLVVSSFLFCFNTRRCVVMDWEYDENGRFEPAQWKYWSLTFNSTAKLVPPCRVRNSHSEC